MNNIKHKQFTITVKIRHWERPEKERKTMKINVFGKKRVTKDGKKTFYNYLSTLTRKNGEEVVVEVKFREECGNPKKVPCVIEFDKKDANFTEHEESYDVINSETGEVIETKEMLKKVLWVNKFTESEYVDTSLEDFE